MRVLWILVCCSWTPTLWAQIADTIQTEVIFRDDTPADPAPLLLNGPDSTINLTKRRGFGGRVTGFFKDGYLDPKKSLLLSAILPGTGQIYNGQWWKAPLVYGAVGSSIWWITESSDRYQIFSEAYRLSIAGEPHDFSGTRIDNAQALRGLRDRYNKNRQQAYMIAVAVYGLQALEAFVAGHLKDFDTEDDLGGWQTRPIMVPTDTGGQVPAWGLVYRF